MTRSVVIALFAVAFGAQAGSSTNYSLAPDAVDHGGLRATSANYTVDFSAMPGGHGTSANYTTRTGYAGQLGDVVATAIELSAPQLTVNELASLQLSADLVFDDLTTSPLDPNDITWSVQSGPLSGINASGLATAAAVYQDSAAVARGTYQSFTDTLDLTVLNTLPDNFGSYASDGIDDDWQVQYFGLNHPFAGPTFDPDYDGQNNLFEFIAGLVPTDAQSRFLVHAVSVSGQPLHKNIIFSPRLTGRSYSVKSSATLGPSAIWTDLTASLLTDNGTQRTITDTDATGARKFYHVEITRP